MTASIIKSKIAVELNLKSEVLIEASDQIEVSLGCAYCQRHRRTIFFQLGEPSGQCSPRRSGITHPRFPGKLETQKVFSYQNIVQIQYELSYEFQPFVDAKYGKTCFGGGQPTWARVKWTMVCPNCGEPCRAFTQNNLVRPFTKTCCICTYQFYVESNEMPILSWLDPEGGSWQDIKPRFGSDSNAPGLSP